MLASIHIHTHASVEKCNASTRVAIKICCYTPLPLNLAINKQATSNKQQPHQISIPFWPFVLYSSHPGAWVVALPNQSNAMSFEDLLLLIEVVCGGGIRRGRGLAVRQKLIHGAQGTGANSGGTLPNLCSLGPKTAAQPQTENKPYFGLCGSKHDSEGAQTTTKPRFLWFPPLKIARTPRPPYQCPLGCGKLQAPAPTGQWGVHTYSPLEGESPLLVDVRVGCPPNGLGVRRAGLKKL